MIKAVIFDIDGVLLDSLDSNCEYFQELFKQAGYAVPSKEILASMYHMPTWNVIKEITGLTSDIEIEKIWKLSENLKYDAKEKQKLTNGVLSSIKELRSKYKLAIVTSRNRKFVFEAPMNLLEDSFDAIVAYQDVTYHKPHPEPLLLASERLGIPVDECVYVGDALSDIQAARAAKMKIIHFGNNDIGKTDGRTDSFVQLTEVIAAL